MRHLFCIPTYNEADNIEFFMEELLSNLRPHSHVLVIDDNSPDGTALIVEKLKEKKDCFKERLHILKRPGKLGLASAYIDAFKWGLEKGANLSLIHI